MRPPIRKFLVALCALTMLGAACGGDDDGGVATDDPTATTVASTGKSVTMLAKWTGEELDAAKQVMAAFTAKTGVAVDLQGVGDDLPTILSTRVEGGDPPDLAQLPQPGLLRDLAARGALKPIEEIVGETVDADYGASWRELGSHDGTLYGVWFKAANKSTVWYSKKAWAEAEVEVPKTWAEWTAASGDLLDAGTTPLAVGGADGWVLSDWFENVYLRTAGPEMYDKLARHEIPWTDPSVKTALARLGEMLGNDKFIAKGRNGALQVGFEDSVKLVFGAAPEAATVYEGDFVANVIRGETEAKAGTDFDFFPFPSVDDSKPAVMGGGDVVVMLSETPEARQLVEYLATPEAAEIWAKIGGLSSPNKKVDLSVYGDEITRRAAEQLVNAETFRFDLSDMVPSALGATKGGGIWARLQQWMADPSKVDEVLAGLEAEAVRAMKA